MKFDTSSISQNFIENVFSRVGARNKAVLGRAALFLALGETIQPEFQPKDSKGVNINDETIIGDELRDLVRAALNHKAGKKLNESEYRQSFKLHFEYGCWRLMNIWEECDNDQIKFISALFKIINKKPVNLIQSNASRSVLPIVDEEIKLKIVKDEKEWSLNGPGTKNGLLVISGEPGSGKSQLALDLLVQLSNCGVRFVFFDLKGELEDDPNNMQQRSNRKKFLELTNAKYIRLIQNSLPINPLYHDSNPTKNSQIASEIASLIKAFAHQLGAKQEMIIREAYTNMYYPDFSSLVEEMENIGASGVELALLKKIVDFNIFCRYEAALPIDEWLDSSIVIDFKEFGNDGETKALTVALILNYLMKKMDTQLAVKNSIQPIKMVLFVDEAHLLLPKENKAGLLASLARQGRSWGFPVWLASQDADKFVTTGINETNFAELAECGIHFSPHILTDSEQKKILGKVFLQKLNKGEAVFRMQGKIVSGITRQFWKDGGQ